MSNGEWETDLRSLIVNLPAKDGDLSIVPLTNVLLQGLLDEVSVDADAPGQVKSVWRKEGRSGAHSIVEGDIWSTTETFQGVRSRGAPGVLDQMVVNGLVLLATSQVERRCVTRMLG